MPEDDYMELGSSGLIPARDGWFFDKYTGYSIDPEGRIFDRLGECIYDPLEDNGNKHKGT